MRRYLTDNFIGRWLASWVILLILTSNSHTELSRRFWVFYWGVLILVGTMVVEAVVRIGERKRK